MYLPFFAIWEISFGISYTAKASWQDFRTGIERMCAFDNSTGNTELSG